MIVYLKLGGSLITDKSQPFSPRIDTISRIAKEICDALKISRDLKLVIGHGSGSFGHSAATKYGIGESISESEQWKGFQKVWAAAYELNNIIMREFIKADLPVISLPPSASVITEEKRIVEWNIKPVGYCLDNNLIPVIFGDVIFDKGLGGVILSTEALFKALVRTYIPEVILLAGKELGVWRDNQNKKELLKEINPSNYESLFPAISTSESTDVTGGMASKVKIMMDVIHENPSIGVRIFSGDIPNNISYALLNQDIGTIIRSLKNS